MPSPRPIRLPGILAKPEANATGKRTGVANARMLIQQKVIHGSGATDDHVRPATDHVRQLKEQRRRDKPIGPLKFNFRRSWSLKTLVAQGVRQNPQ